MDLWDLIEKMRDAIKDEASISAWCVSQYGSTHTVYVGADRDDPPPQEDYPVVVIRPLEQERSINVDYGPMTILLDFVVLDDEKTRVENVVTLVGQKRVFEFREVVEAALFKGAADFGGAWIESAPEVVDTVENFPIFSTMVAYTFRNPVRFNPVLA